MEHDDAKFKITFPLVELVVEVVDHCCYRDFRHFDPQ